MIKNNFETNLKIVDLFPVAGKKMEPSFTVEQISSDGGLLFPHTGGDLASQFTMSRLESTIGPGDDLKWANIC